MAEFVCRISIFFCNVYECDVVVVVVIESFWFLSCPCDGWSLLSPDGFLWPCGAVMLLVCNGMRIFFLK
jgi:hypothetical protein